MARAGWFGWAACATLLALAGGSGRVGEAAGTRFLCAMDIRTLDPALVETTADERGVLACFEGLTSIDPATGQPVGAAAESWETSADGRTWTFKLRDATWRKGPDASFAEAGKVKASDFVYAWLRLFDKDTRSPHSHLLDVLPGVLPLSTDRPRYEALDRIVGDLDGLVGKQKRSLSGREVIDFLNDTERNARGWLAEIGLPEAKQFLQWKEKEPFQAVKAKTLIDALAKERDRLIGIVREAEGHVGVDRSFWAKDDKTVVVQTAGLAPWLPSLLARAPLVPVHVKTVDRRGKEAFSEKENYVSNGAYVSATEFPSTFVDGSGEKTQYKVILAKNPNWRGAAGIGADRIEVLVNEKPDEVLRRYALKELAWVAEGGMTPEELKKVRLAKDAAFKTETPLARDTKTASADLYDASSGFVMFARFSCRAPLDKPEARRALVSLIDREALSKSIGATPAGQTLPTTKRFVHPRTAGMLPNVAAPTWDPAGAKKLYGGAKFTSEEMSWISVLTLAEDDKVGDGIATAWKKAGIPDEASVTVKPAGADYRAALDGGLWDVCLSRWTGAFDDPLAVLSSFTTGNPAGDLKWSNAAYDALVKGAMDVARFAETPDPAAKDRPAVKAALAAGKGPKELETLRRTLLAEAESILLEEAVIVPLWIPVDTGILSPKARGITTGGSRPRTLLEAFSFVGVACD